MVGPLEYVVENKIWTFINHLLIDQTKFKPLKKKMGQKRVWLRQK